MHVKCNHCNKVIYEYVGKESIDAVRACDFVPVGSYPRPVAGEEIKCPNCHSRGWLVKTRGIFFLISRR